jgi:hypothetical protein
MTSRLTNSGKLNHDDAERLAIKALGFLACDEMRLAQFLQATGYTLAAIRTEAASPEFLAGILDFLLSDESLLLVFASHHGVDPTLIARAKDLLAEGSKRRGQR